MAFGESGSQLTGQQRVFVAPYGSVIPSVNREPTTPWALLGQTNGRQFVSQPGALIFHRNNDRIGPSHAVRATADVVVEFQLPYLDPTDYARVLSSVDHLDLASGILTLPLKRDYISYEYSFIMRGQIQSKYGQFPGMYVIPRGVFDGEPRVVTEADGSESLQIVFRALEDYSQDDEDYGLGWLTLRVQ